MPEPAIETLEDWNQRLACCCAMPECPVPIQDCLSISIVPCGYSFPSHEDVPATMVCNEYSKVTLAYSYSSNFDGPIEPDNTKTVTSTVETVDWVKENFLGENGCEERVLSHSTSNTQLFRQYDTVTNTDIRNDESYQTTTRQPDGTYVFEEIFMDNVNPLNNYTDTYEVAPLVLFSPSVNNTWSYGGTTFLLSETIMVDEATTITTEASYFFEDFIDASVLSEKLGEFDFPGDADGNSCVASATSQTLGECTRVTGATKVQVQFKVPSSFEGNYFKLTYDIVTEPTGWDDTIDDPDYIPPDPLPDPVPPVPQVPKPERPSRSYVEDLTREWSGPGSGDQEDASWNIGSPYVMESPGEPGIRKITNLRFYCYPDSPYGVKPQASGEATDLDEDIPLQSRFTSDKHSINLPKILI